LTSLEKSDFPSEVETYVIPVTLFSLEEKVPKEKEVSHKKQQKMEKTTKKTIRSQAINYEEEYRCEYCGETFRLSMSLKYHDCNAKHITRIKRW